MLKIQTILIFSGLVFCPLLEKGYANANPVDVCRKGVSSVVRLLSMGLPKKRETLTQNIIDRLKIMLGEEIRGISPELAQRMDEVFYREVRKRIASLEPGQLRMVRKIVMRDRAFPNVGLRAFASLTNIGSSNSHFAIVFNPNIPHHHPFRRLALIHELEHVIDLASGLEIGRNKTLLLRTEANAAIAEYQYINMAFNLQDLEGLERTFPELPENLDERAKEFLPFPQHTNNGIFVEGMSIKEAVARFINSAFVTRVRGSLTMEQDAYVEAVFKERGHFLARPKIVFSMIFKK